MTDCNDALHELYEFLDGELTEERRAHIEAHITNCSPCLEAFDFQAEIRQVIAHKCRDEAPPELMARIAAALGMSRNSEPTGRAE
jgi:mycothiol system anti-sigma-R factor